MIEQRSEAWFKQRAGVCTASNLAKVMASGRGGTPSTGRANYMAQLASEILTGEPVKGEFQSADMQRGTELEPMARAAYTLATGRDVQEAEFVLHPTLRDTGASPDGLVGSDGLVEIKCPIQATHIQTLRGSKVKREYKLQIAWQLECTGRDWCDFVSFNPDFPPELQLHVRRFLRDEALIAEITEAVTKFQEELHQMVAELREKMEAA